MFIVFEGIDGSGKTTLSNKVAAALGTRGMPVRHIRADGKYASRVSEAIRELGATRAISRSCPRRRCCSTSRATCS